MAVPDGPVGPDWTDQPNSSPVLDRTNLMTGTDVDRTGPDPDQTAATLS